MESPLVFNVGLFVYIDEKAFRRLITQASLGISSGPTVKFVLRFIRFKLC